MSKGTQGYFSIFNDVIGPVMRGPSSSHTAGAFRIGKMAMEMLGRKPEEIICRFDPDGSYAPTYEALGADLAFAAGCLGWDMRNQKYKQSLEHAAKEGIRIKFDIEHLPHGDHPNSAELELRIDNQIALILEAKSTGGGIILFDRINDWNLNLDGKSYATLMEFPEDDEKDIDAWLEKETTPQSIITKQKKDGMVFLQCEGKAAISKDEIDSFKARSTNHRYWISSPILCPKAGDEPYSSADQMLALAKEKGWSLGEVGLHYEMEITKKSREELLADMSHCFDIMKESVESGYDEKNLSLVYSKPTGGLVMDAEKKGALPIGGIHTRAAARAMSCMHVCNSKGVVCAAPTGGSAGVIPGVAITLTEDLKLDRDQVIMSLFAGAAIGLIVSKRATFAAEMAGCQVEIGVAGAMSSAMVCDVYGATADQACHAAAISLQNTMGLVCDPVGGACEIPCQTRNAMAASSAFVNTDIILAGHHNPISLDDCVDASFEVGKRLPVELRCTAKGGVATTPSAKELVRKAKEKAKQDKA